MKRLAAGAVLVVFATGALCLLDRAAAHPTGVGARPLRVIAPVSTPRTRLEPAVLRQPPTPTLPPLRGGREPVLADPRFARTVEGSRQIARAFEAESDAGGRLALLREYAFRIHAGLDDGLAAVPVPDLEVEDLFRRALDDADQKVSLEAIGILSTGFLPTGGALLEEFLGHATDVERRLAAASALAGVDGDRALPQLVFLAEREPTVSLRVNALDGIARVGGPQALATLDRLALAADSAEVRSRAASLANRVRVTASR